ncbi:DNA gyrase subunit A [archaeon]|jgi:DNA gyrase subunit A|nr:DNA gyrase subunit A [archaeon]
MEQIKPILIETEMKESYVDYAMSVIVGRALPDVKDGLKPVHRRILYAMHKTGMYHNKPFKKCARIVGEVLGKYHPHGDLAVYDSLVRMAQDFSLRYPLILGQGNFGSVDGDSAAAMRYTESKLSKISEDMLKDIEKNTVKFVPNFDDSLEEPLYLPAKLPNLLINGSSGIAVGMATNIPPHNVGEIIDAVNLVIDDKDVEFSELLKVVKGPDFPGGGIIYGKNGIINAYKSGRGKIKVRADCDIEERKIIVNEIPYQVNKTTLIETIARLVKDKKIVGISDLRDESDRKGMRIVIELKRDANPELILNQLYRHTQLQTTFGTIMLSLVDGQPRVLSLKEMITYFIEHRVNVVHDRTKFELDKSEKRAHIVSGLKIALSNIDAVVRTIKSSKDSTEAKLALIEGYNLSEIQSQSILDMKLHRLTSLETNKLTEEYDSLISVISEYKGILADESKVYSIIKGELSELKQKYSDERRTKILDVAEDIEDEDLIKKEDVVITTTHEGYVNRLPVDTYRQQNRGGRGIKATGTKEEDFVEDVFMTNTHNHLLFFSNLGKIYWSKAYNIPSGSRYSKGMNLVNLLKMSKDERINTIIPVAEFNKDHYLNIFTKKGLIKKTSLEEYSRPRNGGIVAVNLKEGDGLVDVRLTKGGEELIIATANGKAIRFSENQVRSVGRNSLGVKGIHLKPGDEVIGADIARDSVYTITENGFGKRTDIGDYRVINRGGSGVINIKTSERNGKVVGVRCASKVEDILIVTKNGILIRSSVEDVSKIGRNTQGVRLIRLDADDKVISIARVPKSEESS